MILIHGSQSGHCRRSWWPLESARLAVPKGDKDIDHLTVGGIEQVAKSRGEEIVTQDMGR